MAIVRFEQQERKKNYDCLKLMVSIAMHEPPKQYSHRWENKKQMFWWYTYIYWLDWLGLPCIQLDISRRYGEIIKIQK